MQLSLFVFLTFVAKLFAYHSSSMELVAFQNESLVTIQIFFHDARIEQHRIELTSTNLPIYTFNMSCNNELLSEKLCITCSKHAFIILSTSFFQIDSIRFLFNIDSNPFSIYNTNYQITLFSQNLKIKPKTIAEGKKYYLNFEEQHLSRSKKFYKKMPDFHVCLKTLMRSGTHVFLHSFEEITEEFVGTRYSIDKIFGDHYYNAGGIKGNYNYTRLFWTHNQLPNYEKKKVDKYLFLARDPIELADSLFHFMATKRTHDQKIKAEYFKHPLFKEYFFNSISIQNMSIHDSLNVNQPVYLLRFEDLLMNPVEVFKRALSFIEGVPIERTGLNEKIENYFQSNKLTSFYKKNESGLNINSKSTSDRDSNWVVLFYRLDYELKLFLLNEAADWLQLFGYKNRLEYFIAKTPIHADTKKHADLKLFDFPGETLNEKTLKRALIYSSKQNKQILFSNLSTKHNVSRWLEFKQILPDFFMKNLTEF